MKKHEFKISIIKLKKNNERALLFKYKKRTFILMIRRVIRGNDPALMIVELLEKSYEYLTNELNAL